MPIYEFKCEGCKKIHQILRPMSHASDEACCPDCSAALTRIYTFNRTKEFFPYQDEQYGVEVRSRKHEAALMKQHGHIDTRETKQYEKFKSQRRLARKKPMWFTSAGATKHDRD